MTAADWTFRPINPVFEFDPSDAATPWVTYKWHSLRSHVVNVDVPPDFRCDLASVPNWLMFLCPPTGSHQRAALFHDALYRYQQCSRPIADAIFASIMRQDGVPAWRRWLMYAAVRLCGGAAWRTNREFVDRHRENLKKRAESERRDIEL